MATRRGSESECSDTADAFRFFAEQKYGRFFVRLLNLHRQAYEAEDVSAFRDIYSELRAAQDKWEVIQDSCVPDGRAYTTETGDSESTDLLELAVPSYVDRLCRANMRERRLNDFDKTFQTFNKLNSDLVEHWDFQSPSYLSIHQQKKHVDALRKVWSDVDFPIALDHISTRSSPATLMMLLDGLCVRVSNRQLHPEDDDATTNWYFDPAHPVRVVPGGFNDKVHAWQRFAGEIPHRKAWWHLSRWLTQQTFLSEVAIFYTEAPVFGRGSCTLDFVRFNSAITLGSSINCSHYSTPVGQGITANSWELSYHHFVWRGFIDLIFQLLLWWYVAPISRTFSHVEDPQLRPAWLSRWVLLAIAILGCHGLCTFIVEAIACFSFCGQPLERQSIPRSYANPTTIFCFVAEVFSAYFSIRLAFEHWTIPEGLGFDKFSSFDLWHMLYPELPGIGRSMSANDFSQLWAGSCLQEDPGMLSLLIFTKWLQSILMLMNCTICLPILLPSWMAVTSNESIAFLLYMILFSIGTMMSYYSLPSDLSHPGMETSFEVMFRLFRLDFLGDFNRAELEGLDGRAQGHGSTYYIVRVSILIFSLLFPVVLLNLYVGVLSDVYGKCVHRFVNAAGIYRSFVTCRLLIIRHYWNLLARSIPSFEWCLAYFYGRQKSADKVQPGMWIILPVDSFEN